jgi:hypothetical protein
VRRDVQTLRRILRHDVQSDRGRLIGRSRIFRRD